ncbi:response regulator transcription factor [Amycolatopsis australiensis]|uniref:Response regulator receiver domain-containing protein n=1 Tax=Amycolatopsis australiensis TaxID=546364 RepID=A0A1K1S1U5_9PSEU|nr:response regulator transcription factor [Amycolatopsis australiensis]SFW78278.1 Response regulator receiver domain-containing protein [Amycolatopsis australiensis]
MSRPKGRVLIVEDEEDIRMAVTAELSAAGFVVDAVGTLADAAGTIEAAGHACAVFDRMLPDGDALGFVDALRRRGWTVPVLFLTARDSGADRVAGFTHGGDDYVTKPFLMAELLARVLNLCRRAGRRPPVLRHADLEVDCARGEVRRGGVLLSLSAREFAILEYLATRRGNAVTRAELIEHCWDAEPMANVVDAVVKRLRRKLGHPDPVDTVRGVGYRLS